MNSIELTERHKFKLLEICEELFNDMLNKKDCYCNEDQGAGYTYSDEHGNCDVCNNSSFEFFDNALHFNSVDGRVNIHWFELCIRILPKKLGLSNYKITRLVLEDKHPVDTLYEHFKLK